MNGVYCMNIKPNYFPNFLFEPQKSLDLFLFYTI